MVIKEFKLGLNSEKPLIFISAKVKDGIIFLLSVYDRNYNDNPKYEGLISKIGAETGNLINNTHLEHLENLHITSFEIVKEG
jgi:hypothetical protein